MTRSISKLPIVLATLSLWMIPASDFAMPVQGSAQGPATDNGFITGAGGALLLPDGPADPANEELTFEQVAKPGAQGEVLNGRAEFRVTRLSVTFRALFKDGSTCTATLIGPQVVLTAAHCVDRKSKPKDKWLTVAGSVRLAGKTTGVGFKECVMAPAYEATLPSDLPTPRNAHDFALCQLAERLDMLWAETIDTTPGPVDTGQPLMVAGYGCAEASLQAGKIPPHPALDGKLRVGTNLVDGQRLETWLRLVGVVGGDKAIICPGDSGGAAYAGVKSLAEGDDKGWRAVAVNSAVGPTQAQAELWKLKPPSTSPAEYVSYLSPLSDPAFSALVAQFQKTDGDNRKICGVNISSATSRCRA